MNDGELTVVSPVHAPPGKSSPQFLEENVGDKGSSPFYSSVVDTENDGLC